MDAFTLARVAYHAYGNAVDWKNYQRLPMPAWEHLTEPIQIAWQQAAGAVHEYVSTSPQIEK